MGFDFDKVFGKPDKTVFGEKGDIIKILAMNQSSNKQMFGNANSGLMDKMFGYNPSKMNNIMFK